MLFDAMSWRKFHYFYSNELNFLFFMKRTNKKKLSSHINYKVVISIWNERILHKIVLIANELVLMKRKADSYKSYIQKWQRMKRNHFLCLFENRKNWAKKSLWWTRFPDLGVKWTRNSKFCISFILKSKIKRNPLNNKTNNLENEQWMKCLHSIHNPS